MIILTETLRLGWFKEIVEANRQIKINVAMIEADEVLTLLKTDKQLKSKLVTTSCLDYFRKLAQENELAIEQIIDVPNEYNSNLGFVYCEPKYNSDSKAVEIDFYLISYK